MQISSIGFQTRSSDFNPMNEWRKGESSLKPPFAVFPVWRGRNEKERWRSENAHQRRSTFSFLSLDKPFLIRWHFCSKGGKGGKLSTEVMLDLDRVDKKEKGGYFVVHHRRFCPFFSPAPFRSIPIDSYRRRSFSVGGPLCGLHGMNVDVAIIASDVGKMLPSWVVLYVYRVTRKQRRRALNNVAAVAPLGG